MTELMEVYVYFLIIGLLGSFLLVLRYTKVGFIALYALLQTDIPGTHTMFGLFVEIDSHIQPVTGW